MVKRLSLIAAFCSAILVSGCGIAPPETPDAPSGPRAGDVGASYGFTAHTTDRQHLPLRYQFDWGARGKKEWSQYMPGGLPATLYHAWRTAGAYKVRVRAENIAGRRSEWSPAHLILIGPQQSGYPDTVLANIALGGDPSDMAVLPNGRYAYVANQTAQYVTVVDVEDRKVIKHVTCGSNPYMISAMPGGEYVYSSSEWDEEISVIRTSDNTVIDTAAISNSLKFFQ